MASLKPYTTSIFLVSFPALSAIENLPTTLLPTSSQSNFFEQHPTTTKPSKLKKKPSTNDTPQPGKPSSMPFHFSPPRRLSKRLHRPRLPSTDTQRSAISLPATLSSFMSSSSTSSTSSRARRLASRVKSRFSLSRYGFGRTRGGVVKRGLSLRSRRPSTLDFRCCGAQEEEFEGLMRARSSRLELVICRANREMGLEGPPMLYWQKPNLGFGSDWFAGIKA